MNKTTNLNSGVYDNRDQFVFLSKWIEKRLKELHVKPDFQVDPLDQSHPYNVAFDLVCKEAVSHMNIQYQYEPSPQELMYAFFQMRDPKPKRDIESE